MAQFTRRSILAAAAAAPLTVFAQRAPGRPAGKSARSGQRITGARFVDLGNGAIVVDHPVDGLIVEDVKAERLYRFLENTAAKGAPPAPLTRFVLRRISARDLERGMTRIRHASHAGLIEDVTAYGSGNCANYCVGFALDDEAHDIIYRRVQAHGFAEATRPRDKYWNGDGFTDERGNRAIRYLDCVASGCSDGGFDLKSSEVMVIGCTARGNKRNFRLWGNGRLERCTSENPKWHGGVGGPAHFSFHGPEARYVIDRPVVRADPANKAPVFLFDTKAPAEIEIRNADIDAPGAPLIVAGGQQIPKIKWVPARAAQKIRTAK